MAAPYSEELRRKVILACERGMQAKREVFAVHSWRTAALHAACSARTAARRTSASHPVMAANLHNLFLRRL